MANEPLWTPIQPLTDDELKADSEQFDALNAVWQEARKGLEEDNGTAFQEFQERLRRSWSIETGILENLYLLSRGTTQTLIDQGFKQDLIDRASSNTDPSWLIEILKDHLVASDLIQELIEAGRPLTLFFIKELHSVLTQHQVSVEGVDSLGQSARSEVIRGQWRNLPSWHVISTGEKVFYCPHEQIEGQMEDLLEFFQLQEGEERSLCHLAAWLHHRFTLVHPFQDGNGRVARALVNYLFIKANLFPVVVDRDQRVAYLDALESADDGDVGKLVGLFADKEIDAIKKALSLAGTPELARESPLVLDLAQGILERRRRRQESQQAQFRAVNDALQGLGKLAEQHLIKQTVQFCQALNEGGLANDVDVAAGGPENDTQHYYRWEVILSAHQAEQWANFDEESRWVRALVDGAGSKLRFIVSLHHVGRVLTGVGEVTTFADIEGTEQDPDAPKSVPNRRPVYCMIRPFSVTWRSKVSENEQAFEEWLQECFAIALREWAETV